MDANNVSIADKNYEQYRLARRISRLDPRLQVNYNEYDRLFIIIDKNGKEYKFTEDIIMQQPSEEELMTFIIYHIK